MTPTECVIAALERHAFDVREAAGGWECRCPAHDDSRPSLSIAEGDDGRCLLHCHAGCGTSAIVEALGLRMADLMPRRANDTPAPPSGSRRGGTRKAKSYPTRDAALEAMSRAVCRDIYASHADARIAAAGYEYHHADGSVAGAVARWDWSTASGESGKEIRQLSRLPDGRWTCRAMPEPRPLYGLPELQKRPGEPVLLCEGERVTDAAVLLGMLATTCPGGCKAAKKADWSPLAGRDVVILPDADDAGERYVDEVAATLVSLTPPATARVLRLPGLKPGSGDDLADWLERGRTKAELLKLLETEAVEWEPADKATGLAPDDPPQKKSKATKLTELAMTYGVFWVDPEADRAYVSFSGENIPLRSKAARRWLAGVLWAAEQTGAGSQAIQDAINTLEAHAFAVGERHVAQVRVAGDGDTIYLDLADSHRRAVKITKEGWDIVPASDTPIKFVRPKALLALPAPERGGRIDELRAVANVDNDDWPLVAGWLAAAVRPSGPYPVLLLTGEQGSAKTTTARILRSLIDPNAAPERTAPRDERDLAIAASASWVLSFDNLSSLPVWLSDALCRVSTGGGFATRTLYADDEETLFTFCRPAVLTGITAVATRGDLLDRCITITLPTIPEDGRVTAAEVQCRIDALRPRLLGALLDAVATALRRLPEVRLDRLPRMADFALWATAAEPGLGLADGEFMAAYDRSRDDATKTILESSPIAPHIMAIAASSWEGTSSELLAAISELASDLDRRSRSWPATPRKLSGDLRRLAPTLRSEGVEVEQVRSSDRTRKRLIRLTATKQNGYAGNRPHRPHRPKVEESPEKQGPAPDGIGRCRTVCRTVETPKTATPDGSDGSDGILQPHSVLDQLRI